jgi:predicted PurR-regulated permease PerM
MSYIQEKKFQFWVFISIGFIGLIWLFQPILTPFIVGFAVAYLLNPIIAKLEKLKIPRWISAFTFVGLFFIAIIVGLAFAIPHLFREVASFIKILPVMIAHLQDWIAVKFPMIEIPRTLDDLQGYDPSILTDKAGSVFEISKNLLGNIFKSGMALIGFVSFLFLMPIIAFYLLIDWPRVNQKIQNLIPKKNEARIKKILKEIDTSLAGFIRGQLIVATLLGLFYAIALSLLGLEYGFMVGVLSGILSIIPYVGSAFGLVASVGLAFYQFGGWEYPVSALAIFVAGQMVEGNYLTPKLVGESVGLHPIWIIFALMAGGSILGLLGMVIAIPVAAIVAVLVRHGFEDYQKSSYYKGR